MELVTSRLLADLPHGFTTREGGSSRPPWGTLNLGDQVGDDPLAVEANWRALGRATGLGFARVRQVHGATLVRATAPAAPSREADAVLSETPGLAACVAVADCVPVLLAREDGGAVAAVHAGWKGTLARAAVVGLRALAADPAAAATVRSVIGPSIGPCCYQVSAELAERFAAAFGPEVVVPGPRGPHLDLWAANELALRQCGVTRVEQLRRCTSCDPERFFSHRRDAGTTGRMVAFVAPRPISTGRAVP